MPRLLSATVGLCLIAGAATASAQSCDHLPDLSVRAATDDPVAQYNLAVEFFRGTCVERDLSRAALLWRKVVQTGDLSAHNNLGYLTFHGLGVPRDEKEGVRLLRYAAERGQSESQFHLAYAYWTGRGVTLDPVRAWAWGTTSISSAQRRSPPDDDTQVRALLAEIEPTLSPRDRQRSASLARTLIERHSPRPR